MSTASRFLASVGNGSSNSRSTRTTFFMTVLANRSFQGLAANRSSTNLLFWPYTVPSGPTARAKSSVVYPPPAPSSATRMRGVMAAKARSSAGRRPASSSRSFSLRFDASTAARSEGGTSTAVTCFAPGGGVAGLAIVEAGAEGTGCAPPPAPQAAQTSVNTRNGFMFVQATNTVAMATAQPHHLASIEDCPGSDDDPVHYWDRATRFRCEREARHRDRTALRP